MIHLREVLLQHIFTGDNAVIHYEEDGRPVFLIVHSQKQALQLLSQCADAIPFGNESFYADAISVSKLPRDSHVSPIHIAGSAAVVFERMSDVIREYTMTCMLAVNSEERIRIQYFEEADVETVAIVHATTSSGWRVHVAYSKQAARQIFLDYHELYAIRQQSLHRSIEESPLPESSGSPSVSIYGDAAIALGLTAEEYWQIKNVFQMPTNST